MENCGEGALVDWKRALMGIRVLVADDAELIRRGIKTLLKDRGDISVIGEASNLPETIQKAAELLPDVIIIDLRMAANVNGELNHLTNGPMLVVISFDIGETADADAKKLGAMKFIDKTHLANDLIPTLLQISPRINLSNAVTST